MKVYKEITSLYDFEPWSGAVETYNKLIESHKSEEFIDQLEQEFEEQYVSETTINDMLWFEPEMCFSLVGLDKDGNENNDEDGEEDGAEE